MLLGEDPDPVIAAGHENLGVAVGGRGVVRELELVALDRRVQHPLVVEVEQETRVELVVNLAPAVRLRLRDELAGVLAEELILPRAVLQEATPSLDAR